GEPELIAVLHPWGNRDLEEPLLALASLAAAGLARVAVDASLAVAGRTRAGHGEKALGEAHLAVAATGAARRRLGARRLPGAPTARARLEARDLQLGLDAVGRFLERDLEVVAEVVAPMGAGAPAAAASAAEEALDQVLEDGREAGVRAAARRRGGGAEAV